MPTQAETRDRLDEVVLERHDGVALITLTAPARRNAITVPMARELIAVCEEVDQDVSIGAVVLSGGAYFCAGGDRATLAAAGEAPADPEQFDAMAAIYESFARVGRLQAPTIAAIRGGAVGAGLNLALATDLRIVGDDAVLTSGFIRIGLHPGGGHGVLLGRMGSRETASALALFGQSIDGRRAVAIGLAWGAFADGEVEDRALALARGAAGDPELSRRVAASIRTQLGPPPLPWTAALEFERAAQMWSMRRPAYSLGQATRTNGGRS